MNIRHGDLALIEVKKLPQGLKKAKTKVMMTGSGGKAHSFDKGELYLKDGNTIVFGYLQAKTTTLFHPGHGKKKRGKFLREARIPNRIYELRQQHEDTHEGMKQVVD